MTPTLITSANKFLKIYGFDHELVIAWFQYKNLGVQTVFRIRIAPDELLPVGLGLGNAA